MIATDSNYAVSVTLAILAGGRGSRMGATKDRLTVLGRPILLHLLKRSAFAGPTLLIASPEHPSPVGAEAFDVVALDESAGEGPLAGIIAGLSAAKTDAVCFLSVDMPGVGAEQFDWLATRLSNLPGEGVNGFVRTTLRAIFCSRCVSSAASTVIEPFPCIVQTSALPAIRSHFAAGGRSMRSLMQLPGFFAFPVPGSWPKSVWLNLNRLEDLPSAGVNLG